eukprot:m.344991 g.344991  ORF g.344991 m.344991 type:complete len:698 (-) comp27890_c0_seq5:114-2207(-)
MGNGASAGRKKTRRVVPKTHKVAGAASVAVPRQDSDYDYAPPSARLTKQPTKQELEAFVRNKVDRAIRKITSELTQLHADWTTVMETGTIPENLAADVTAETLDAIGTMYCTVESLKAQKNEIKGNLLKSIIGRNRTSDVNVNLDKQNQWVNAQMERLKQAKSTLSEWSPGLDSAPVLAKLAGLVPESSAQIAALCNSLPLASTDPSQPDPSPTSLTVQRLMGLCVLNDKRKHAAAALKVYNQRRGQATGELVATILKDIESYDAVCREITGVPGAEGVLLELDRLSHLAPQPFGDDLKPLDIEGFDDLVLSTAGNDAPRSSRVEYAVYIRKLAGAGSIALYNIVANVVVAAETADGSVHGGAYVVPGGVKKLARCVFKTVTKYNCDFQMCKDIMRCTVVTTSLASVAQIVKAIFASTDVVVVRVKNRFAAGFDSKPAGGYRDYQLLVVFKSSGKEGERWLYGEIQVNLEQMVEIKARPQGGHAMYKFARSLAIFDENVYTYSGSWSKRAADQIAAGVLMNVNMQGAFTEIGNIVLNMSKIIGQLAASLRSPKCRVQHLNLQYNDLKSSGRDIADALRDNTSVVAISMGGNALGPEGGIAFAEALKINDSLTSVDLCANNLGDEGGNAIATALLTNTTVCELGLSNNGFNLETEAEIRKAWGTRDGTLELSKPVKEASVRQSASLLNVKKFCVNIVR